MEAMMSLERAAELVLQKDYEIRCIKCDGDGINAVFFKPSGGGVELCLECEGQGYLIDDAYIEARRILGLPRPLGRSFREVMDSYDR